MKYKTRFAAYFAVVILFNLASSFGHPVTPTIIQDLHLHDYMFGVALAMLMTANFLFSPFWGKINGYISSRVSLLICGIGYGAAQLWFGFATTEAMIMGARFMAGVFAGGGYVSFLTYIVNIGRPEDQPRFLTYCATAQSVPSAFGYLVGGVIGEFSVQAVFIVQALLLAASGVLFFVVCLPDRISQDKLTARQLARDSNPLRAFLDCRQFLSVGFVLLFALNVLVNFANTGFDQAFNYYLKDQLALSSAYNGIIRAGVGLVSFVSNMTLCIWIIRKTNTGRSMALLTAVCALAAAGAVFSPKIGLFIAFSVLVYAGYSVSQPVLQHMTAERAEPEQKNLVMGMYNATKSLGSIAGSLTAGFIYAAHAKLPFVCTAVIYAVGIAAAAVYLRCSRKNA